MSQSFQISLPSLFHSNDRLNTENDLHLMASQCDGLSTSPVFLKDESSVVQVSQSDRLTKSPDSLARKMSENELQTDSKYGGNHMNTGQVGYLNVRSFSSTNYRQDLNTVWI